MNLVINSHFLTSPFNYNLVIKQQRNEPYCPDCHKCIWVNYTE
jgi:hypothetical protein